MKFTIQVQYDDSMGEVHVSDTETLCDGVGDTLPEALRQYADNVDAWQGLLTACDYDQASPLMRQRLEAFKKYF